MNSLQKALKNNVDHFKHARPLHTLHPTPLLNKASQHTRTLEVNLLQTRVLRERRRQLLASSVSNLIPCTSTQSTAATKQSPNHPASRIFNHAASASRACPAPASPLPHIPHSSTKHRNTRTCEVNLLQARLLRQFFGESAHIVIRQLVACGRVSMVLAQHGANIEAARCVT